MGKPRMLGRHTGFVPNSQADRRRVNRTFRHREYQKKVEEKKGTEYNAAIAEYNAAIDKVNRIMKQYPGFYDDVVKMCSDLIAAVSQILRDYDFPAKCAKVFEPSTGKGKDENGLEKGSD